MPLLPAGAGSGAREEMAAAHLGGSFFETALNRPVGPIRGQVCRILVDATPDRRQIDSQSRSSLVLITRDFY